MKRILATAACLLLVAGEVRAQKPSAFVSLSMYPNALPALAPAINTEFSTKADWDGGTLHNVTSAGGTFSTPILNDATVNNVTINSGLIDADISDSTVNGTPITTVLQGFVPMPPNGIPALGTNGKIPASYIGDLTGATLGDMTLAAAISASGGTVTDATGLAVTVNGHPLTVGPAISSATTIANAALPASSAGPLATQAGASGAAAIAAALGFPPYSAANPAGYVTSTSIAATAPVQSVAGQKGAVTANQIATSLAGQDLSAAVIGGGKTGTQVQASQATDETNIAAAAKQASSAATLASAALPAASAGPLATVSGANAAAAAVSALGFTPYNSTNPAGYVTSASVAATAPVQTVVGQKGAVTAAQVATALSGLDLSGSVMGGGKTGTQIQAAQVSDEATILANKNGLASANVTATSAFNTANSAYTAANAAVQPATAAGAENITVSPQGNTTSTLSSQSVFASAKSSSQREFMVNLGFSSNTGGGTANADKVTLYGGVSCSAGSGNCWAANFLGESLAGFTGEMTGSEFDVNNFGTDAPPYVAGHQVNGVGVNGSIVCATSTCTNYMTSGYSLASVGLRPIFHYGFALYNNAAKDAAYYDEGGTSTFSYYNHGPHTQAVFADGGGAPYGLDLASAYPTAAITTAGATTQYAMQMGANQKVCFYGAGACAYYKKSAEVWIFTNSGGTPVMQISATGTVTITGTIIQNGQITP